jgi:hypothetical protein
VCQARHSAHRWNRKDRNERRIEVSISRFRHVRVARASPHRASQRGEMLGCTYIFWTARADIASHPAHNDALLVAGGTSCVDRMIFLHADTTTWTIDGQFR